MIEYVVVRRARNKSKVGRAAAIRSTCEVCGQEFLALRSAILQGRGTTCSSRCRCAKAARYAALVESSGKYRRGQATIDGRAHPQATIARNALGKALRLGTVVRPSTCEKCGSTGRLIDGHHEDYSQPLAVWWLCKPCHFRRHNEMGRLGIRPKGLD